MLGARSENSSGSIRPISRRRSSLSIGYSPDGQMRSFLRVEEKVIDLTAAPGRVEPPAPAARAA